MSSSSKSFLSRGDSRLSLSNRGQSLNPNAAEFIPTAFRHSPHKMKTVDGVNTDASGISDEEAQHYWQVHLPDDITPDFNSMGKEEFSLSRLSIHDGINHVHATPGNSKVPSQDNTLQSDNSENLKMWDSWNISSKKGEGEYSGNQKDIVHDHITPENMMIEHLKILYSRFPDFAVESLAELYYSNGCDLNFTMELINQLEHKVDMGFNLMNPKAVSSQALDGVNLNSFSDNGNGLFSKKNDGYSLEHKVDVGFNGRSPKAVSSHALNGVELNLFSERGNGVFPKKNEGFSSERKIDAGFNLKSPTAASSQTLNGVDLNSFSENGNGFFSKKNERFSLFDNALSSRDFIPSSHNREPWKYEHGLSSPGKTGPIRNLHALASPYNPHGKTHLGKILPDYAIDMREEEQSYAQVQSAIFGREKEFYPMARKVLGKEVGIKGPLYGVQVKEVQEKPIEVMHHPSRGPNPLIDLHGLHVNEAIHVLKHELNILKRTAKSAGRRLQVIVCVGTGGPAQSPRPLTRLPAAVQQYLLHENLHFSEDQPGLLRVVIC